MERFVSRAGELVSRVGELLTGMEVSDALGLGALIWAIISTLVAWRLQKKLSRRAERREYDREAEAALADAVAVGHAVDPLLEDGSFPLPDPEETDARTKTAIRGLASLGVTHPDEQVRDLADRLVQELNALRYEVRSMRADEERLGERTKAMALNVEFRVAEVRKIIEMMGERLRSKS